MAEEIYWKGKSGKSYSYLIYPIGTSFKDAPGNYLYAKKNAGGKWVAVYIGQTSNLKDRLADHEKEGCAKRNGATHIHAHTSSSVEANRRAEETDLIANYEPPCNG